MVETIVCILNTIVLSFSYGNTFKWSARKNKDIKRFHILICKGRSSVHTTFNLYVLFSPFNFESLFIMERVSAERK